MSGASGADARRALPSRAGLLVPWSAMLLSSLGLAGLGRLAVPAGDPATATPALASVVAALALIPVAAVLALDRLLLAPRRVAQRVALPDRTLAQRYLAAAHLALWALAELPAILGFAHLLLGGALSTHLALCAVSLALLAYLMPTGRRISGALDAVVH